MFPWINANKYRDSAANLFLESFTIPELNFPCNGFYMGEHIFDECGKGDFEATKSGEMGEIKTANPLHLAAAFCKNWAKCFRIGYENGTAVFDFDNGQDKQRACLKISVDWRKWAAVYFDDYLEFGDELLYKTYLAGHAHPEIDETPSAAAFEKGKLIFKDWDGKEMFKKSPGAFMEDIAEATRQR